jgi:hypothetical protein
VFIPSGVGVQPVLKESAANAFGSISARQQFLSPAQSPFFLFVSYSFLKLMKMLCERIL